MSEATRTPAPPAPARGFVTRHSQRRPFCRRCLQHVPRVARVDTKDGDGLPDTIDLCPECVLRPDHEAWLRAVERNRVRWTQRNRALLSAGETL